jgi:acetylornithine/succinyldiaminopimelate/putrescine aminotransferase
MPDHRILAFGDSAAVADVMSEEDCAGVLLEPIQSMAGARTAPAEFFQSLRKLCDKSGAKLIYDEIQTGIGRTGDYFFAPLHGVVPDMMTLAKGLASGVPMGALLVSEDIAKVLHSGDLGSTFGGGPLAAAAMKATLEVIRDEELLANVKKVGKILCSEISNLPQVKSVSGMGFLLGLNMKGKASYYQAKLQEQKIIVGNANDPAVLRLLPPLTLSLDQAAQFIDTLAKVPVQE